MTTDVIADAQQRLREFAAARDWQKLHTPKNLAMALAGEVGELLALYQWMTPEETTNAMADEATRAAVEDEIADIAIYLFRLADVLDVDMLRAVMDKVTRNETRYPPPPGLGDVGAEQPGQNPR